MNSLQLFNTEPFINALKAFFIELKVPVDYLADEPASPTDILGERFKATNEAHQLIADVYALGLVNDGIFEGTTTFNDLAQVKKLITDYDGLLIFGITLYSRPDGLLPTRSQLAEITRIFNRVFPYTPVTIVFKYDTYISFANSERVKYLQEWREGEKIGKVSLLRDINFTRVHAGHYRILNDLAIARTGKNAINSFSELYKYWQSTLSVSILNKAFYGELQNWYFWAIQEVHFPNPPLRIDFSSDNDFDEALKEHKGKNVIRLLTRILFIWFIKEKGLIPEEIFDEKTIANQILDEFVPQKPESLFATGKQNSKYYRAILQNLFFATLNQPCKKREFRAEGKHQNVTQLMRYKSYFKDADYFVGLMEAKVPFMNGGLFECLDKPHPTAKGKQGGDRIIYVDGFSDRVENDILVPDYLFFDADEEVDLSNELGNNKAKNSKTRGLIAILKSYKFTITENTPIDEDVALDPELLGKVFENLLASYNPETKTTARKQTGSFYTPREIVDYMVDESLIAYLKNHISAATEKLDEELHQLVSYSSINPFAEDEATQKAIIKSLDKCTILDPACGSGAYPMGILQKMVHILHKIDPNNTEWKNRQLRRVDNAIAELEQLDDNTLRESTIRELELQKKDIEESFANNELDYGRKLYLIENCIFGVDIQPIATQISKLRFFISLVVDQKVDAAKENFGVRPLPNLETKFVAANTLIGIEKPQKKGDFFGSLFDKNEVQKLEKDLKKVRQRLFSAKTPSTKHTLREQDKTLREQMGDLLVEEYGNATARQLANWDPYDQNTSSPFFDKEWMFDIREGFDIVIGNPPYVQLQKMKEEAKIFKQLGFETFESTGDLYCLFYEKGIQLLKQGGIETYITSSQWLKANYGKSLRKYFLKHNPLLLLELGPGVFESATVDSNILIVQKSKFNNSLQGAIIENIKNISSNKTASLPHINEDSWAIIAPLQQQLNQKIIKKSKPLKDWKVNIYFGVKTGYNEAFIIDKIKRDELVGRDNKSDEIIKPVLKGREVEKYITRWDGSYLINTLPSLKINIDSYSSIKVFLEEFGKRLHQTGESFTENGITQNSRKKTQNKWFETQDAITFHKEFSKEKIIWKRIGSLLRFSYSDEEIFCLDSTCIATGEKMKYLTAFLNSKLCHYQLFENAPKTGMGDLIISVQALEPLQVYYPTEQEEIPFIDLVDKILECKKAGENTQALEDEIDLRVYKLYELTHAEVLVIDPNLGMSAAAYESIVY
jgi:adenine-specific DNA-methyltransferase